MVVCRHFGRELSWRLAVMLYRLALLETELETLERDHYRVGKG